MLTNTTLKPVNTLKYIALNWAMEKPFVLNWWKPAPSKTITKPEGDMKDDLLYMLKKSVNPLVMNLRFTSPTNQPTKK
ncbi:hypothetical protein MASR1M65_07570 [Saprospiraceae bacterium]